MKKILLLFIFIAIMFLNTMHSYAFIPPADEQAPLPILMSNSSSVALVQQADLPAHERTLFESVKEFLAHFFSA